MEQTILITMTAEDLRTIIREEVQAAIAKVERKHDLPPVLTRSEVMELLQIGHSKASELFGRTDFPTCRELGGVKVRTDKLFEWMDQHTNWVEGNAKPLRSIS